MTAYYNLSLLKNEGDWINRQDKRMQDNIAWAVRSPGNRNILHKPSFKA